MLTLTVLRCPDAVPPQTRRAEGGEITIGRGPDNDWVLPDPDRRLSRRHCVLAFRSGGWYADDPSANGTFLNRDSAPIGPGKPRPLRNGDRLRLGAYEIEVSIAETRHGAAGQARAGESMAAPFAEDPFTEDPFGESLFPPVRQTAGCRVRGASDAAGLPSDFDPMAPDQALSPFASPTQPDHTPALNDAFRPRPTSTLPNDWDIDPSLGGSHPGAAPAPAPAPEPPAPPPGGLPAAGDAQDNLLADFLRGAGMPDAQPADAAATMEALGQAFRALVAGLRQAMIARAAVKGEFRIEQTMIRARGNNPLKFSAGDDDALAALLGTGRLVGMTPAQAVAEALSDIRLHELATVAALRAAVRAIIARFDPNVLRGGADAGALAMLPAQRKARAWDAFERLHASVAGALEGDFDGVFGKAFARAYEQAVREITAKDGRR